MQGEKNDTEKVRMELLPMDALLEVSKVLTYGAKKYAPGNWKTVLNAKERYTGALLRHLTAYRNGEDHDPEAGEEEILHIAQVACNALFLVWFKLKEEKKND